MSSESSLPIPENESDRVRRLHSLEILDTLPESAYDDITLLAAEIANTPIALVSLVDANRQWFKSRHGLEARETPRDMAFCAHAIMKPGETMVVPDACLDPRFASNPLVSGDPNIRFYLGAPLVLSDGMPLGTLCVIDREPRSLTPRQQRAIEALSRQVVAQIELRHTLKELNRLSGMLPICSHCKKVRDDDGYWQQVERYISEHSQARFSHGICPSCLEIHYPGVMKPKANHDE